MQRRLRLLRTVMADADVDVALLTSYHNVKYYSDFLYTSFGRSYALIVTQDEAITVSANIDGGMPWRRSVDDNVVYTDWQRDNFVTVIRQTVRDRGISPRRIGVEDDELPVQQRDKFQAAFPSAELTDISAATMRQRMVKSAEELGGEGVRAAITAGVAEFEVALAGTEAMVHEIARTYPQTEIRDTWVWFQSGINTYGAHNWPTTRRVQQGDILSLNCFPMISGYYTALERTLFFGQPDDRSLDLWQANVDVHRRGLELIRPGVTCSSIAHTLNEIYADRDLLSNRTFGYGHSFGVLSHYYGREAGLELREDVDTVLEPGNVVSMEPMIMVPEGEPGAGGGSEEHTSELQSRGH